MRQKWLWALIGLIGFFLLVSDVLIGLVTLLPVAGLLFVIRLTTEVREDGVYVQFAPIHRSFRRIPFDQIERVEVTEFGLLTYGGIGLRWTPNAVAYMTKRGRGIKISRQNAKAVVIGSQDADTLAGTVGEFL
jgi:hypothetical protein